MAETPGSSPADPLQAAQDALASAADGSGPPVDGVSAAAAAQAAIDSASAAVGQAAAEATPFAMPDFKGATGAGAAAAEGLDLLADVSLNVKIELGRTKMLVEDVLKLGQGSVVELDKLAGDPVDVYVNDRLVARGEVLVLNDNFCVRVNEIISATANKPAR
jgi:flagellar motor switch protein FliN/FliY